jgi:hypothetical protein
VILTENKIFSLKIHCRGRESTVHALHGNFDWLGMIPVVDNNGQEELTSVYVAVHYAILYQRLAQHQGIQQSTHFYFQAFSQ